MQGKKVLVTGADGFIGSHLTELLVEHGAQVRALCQYNSFNFWGWLENSPVRERIEIVCGDIRDPHFCSQLTEGIDTVFHLAALIAIPYSYAAPDSYLDTNAKGTLNICQAALKSRCARVIHTSTSEVYGTAMYVPIDEKHPLQPQSPYSATKIAADAMALSFYNSHSLPVTVARPFNTYGPRQSARAIIPTVITQLLAGNHQISVGDLRPTRDFNYVHDTCMGFLALSESERTIGETINIGSGREISIGDTIQLIGNILGKDVNIKEDAHRLRPDKSEVFRLCCDNSKIKSLTGFEPKHTLEEGLRKTIEWFANPANLKMYKPEIYNV